MICLPDISNPDAPSLVRSIELLKNRSKASAENTDKDVKHSVFSLLSVTLEKIGSEPNFEAIEESFEAYWSIGCEFKQSCMVWNFIQSLNEYLLSLLSKDNFAMLLSNTTEPGAAKQRLSGTVWKMIEIKAQKHGFGQCNTGTGFPNQIKFFIFTMKALCTSSKSCMHLPNLALADSFPKKQRHYHWQRFSGMSCS